MYKKRLIISIASFSFVLLLTLGVLLNIESGGISSGEALADTEIASAESLSAAFIKVAKEVKPSVVNISTTSRVSTRREPFWDLFDDDFFRRFFPDEPRRPREPSQRRRRSLGSGVIISSDGYILTNNHVVENAEQIKVSLQDKHEYSAEVVGKDKETDVAVIKIDAEGLPAAKLGRSDDLQVGQWVLAIGNPLRLSHTVTAGIISATGRSNVGLATYEDFIQTDASINPGNSGGPLVNIKGEVIGINTAIATASGIPGNIGIGFAIPINMALNIKDQLIETGKVVRGWLGIQLQEVTMDIAEKYGLDDPQGVLVASLVGEDGPAEKAGIEAGDLIIEFDDQEVIDSAHLKRLVAAADPGDKVGVVVIRDGDEKSFRVKLGERTDELLTEGTDVTPETEEWLGLSVQELTDELARGLGYEDEYGVVITSIDPDGPAAKVEDPPRRRDLIQEIEGTEIKSMDDYNKAIEETKDQKSVMIRLRRANGRTWYVVIKKEENKE
ncbi:Do family serine endopeptidase [Candidatus Poribacteria bacterium]|nr:Do family serine endopeptidase [Candidatus Poribacteria bacterium]